MRSNSSRALSIRSSNGLQGWPIYIYYLYTAANSLLYSRIVRTSP